MRTDDDINPNLIFQLTDTELLVGIVNETIDPYLRAARELAKRGLNHKGEWVGFKPAAAILNDYTKRTLRP